MPSHYRPTALAKLGEDRLQITWNDGHIGTIAWTKLREACPCASCNEDRHRIFEPVAKPSNEGLSLRVLQEKEIPKHGPVKPTALTPVGNYAYKIVWSDGHDTGLFTFEFLHSLCEWPSPLSPPGRGVGGEGDS
jgi:DUF971 family protein